MPISKTFAGAVGGSGTAVGSLTISGLDSTGFNYAVIVAKHEGTPTTITASDNKSSPSWTAETKVDHANGDLSSQQQWVKIGTPGSGHSITVTFGASRPWPFLEVWFANAPGGTLVKDAEAHNSGSGTAVDAGTLSTTGASVVSFMGFGLYNVAGFTTPGGWTEDFDGTTAGGTSGYGASRGPETTTPIDPAATWTGANDAWTANSLSLREPSGGGTTFTQSCSGAISPTGSLAKQVNKVLIGTLSFVGTIKKAISRTLSGVIAPSGALTKKTNKSMSGAVTPVGTLNAAAVIRKATSGVLSFTGTLTTLLIHAGSSAAQKIRTLGQGFGVWR